MVGHGVANALEVALQLGHRSKVGCSAIHQEVQPVKEPKHLAEAKSLRLGHWQLKRKKIRRYQLLLN